MRRTEVNVFLVAMAILPFLQNMFLNIGTGHYIHLCMYTVYLQCKIRHVYMNFRQNSSPKNTFPISEKNFRRDCSLHTQRLTQRKPLSWTFCLTLMYVFIRYVSILQLSRQSATEPPHPTGLASPAFLRAFSSRTASSLSCTQSEIHPVSSGAQKFELMLY